MCHILNYVKMKHCRKISQLKVKQDDIYKDLNGIMKQC